MFCNFDFFHVRVFHVYCTCTEKHLVIVPLIVWRHPGGKSPLLFFCRDKLLRTSGHRCRCFTTESYNYYCFLFMSQLAYLHSRQYIFTLRKPSTHPKSRIYLLYLIIIYLFYLFASRHLTWHDFQISINHMWQLHGEVNWTSF